MADESDDAAAADDDGKVEHDGDALDPDERRRLLEVVRTSADEEELRRAAMRLGDAGVAEAVEPLIALLARAAPRPGGARDGAAIGLRELADPRALEPLVTAIRRSTTNEIGTLVYALQTLDCRPIVEFLAGLAVKGRYEVRAGVAGCFERMDVGSVAADVRERAMRVLREAAADTADVGEADELAWLAELLQS
jgi:hypothetical protein